MSFDLRLAFVTGGGSGIGRAIALALAAEGAQLAVLDLNRSAAHETTELVTRSGGRAKAFQADTSKAEEVDAAVSEAVAQMGPLEIMVNNAGILDGYFNVDELDESTWRRVIDIDSPASFSAANGHSWKCCLADAGASSIWLPWPASMEPEAGQHTLRPSMVSSV